MPSSDQSIALTAAAIALTTIARRKLAQPETLAALLDQPDCRALGRLVTELHAAGERDRARGVLEQATRIRELGGFSAVLEAASPHAREAWEAATWVARGEK